MGIWNRRVFYELPEKDQWNWVVEQQLGLKQESVVFFLCLCYLLIHQLQIQKAAVQHHDVLKAECA